MPFNLYFKPRLMYFADPDDSHQGVCVWEWRVQQRPRLHLLHPGPERPHQGLLRHQGKWRHLHKGRADLYVRWQHPCLQRHRLGPRREELHDASDRQCGADHHHQHHHHHWEDEIHIHQPGEHVCGAAPGGCLAVAGFTHGRDSHALSTGWDQVRGDHSWQ